MSSASSESLSLTNHSFDRDAARYDEMPWHNSFRDWLSQELITRQGWIGIDFNSGRQLKVLDYAAGTGVFSQALAPYASEIIGVDASEKMVATYNAKFREQSKIRAVVGDLTSETAAPNDGELWGFDLVVIGLGFHHFNDAPSAAKKLVERLKPGGVFLMVDMKGAVSTGGHGHQQHSHGHNQNQQAHSNSHSEHKHGHGHHHHGESLDQEPVSMPSGYSEQDILNMVGSTGLVDVAYEDAKMCFSMERGPNGMVGSFGPWDEDSGGSGRGVFMARGRKSTVNLASI